jgi:hypothetical protein
VTAAGMEPYFIYKLTAGSLKKEQEDGKVTNLYEIQCTEIKQG